MIQPGTWGRCDIVAEYLLPEDFEDEYDGATDKDAYLRSLVTAIRYGGERDMQVKEEYRGYSIVETNWTTTVSVGGAEEERPVYIIRGLKERPSRPFLTSLEECRQFIDEELRARVEMDEAMSETWDCRIRSNGNAGIVTVPAETMRRLGLEIGDDVRVRISRR